MATKKRGSRAGEAAAARKAFGGRMSDRDRDALKKRSRDVEDWAKKQIKSGMKPKRKKGR